VKKFEDLIRKEGYLPQQIFNGDETGLFWKRLPNQSYITQEEMKLPGHKPMKDRLTLLLAANASGDFKLKPLLIYHSENPRCFGKKIIKYKLPVMWKSNAKAWVDQKVFKDWIFEVFAPSVKKFLTDNNLPLKALLILDNASAHPQDLEDILGIDFDFIKVQFLPPNTTSLIQPMDQEVIACFKKLYTRALFSRLFDVTNSSGKTLKDFWKTEFNILHAISFIKTAWDGVTQRTLRASWKTLVPSFSQDNNNADQSAGESEAVAAIVSMAESLDIGEVDEADVEELLEDHDD
jgi:hypothetical protein